MSFDIKKNLGEKRLKFAVQYYDILRNIVQSIDGGRMALLLNEDTIIQER